MRMPRQTAVAVIGLGDTMTPANFTDGVKLWSDPKAAVAHIRRLWDMADSDVRPRQFTYGVLAVPTAAVVLLLMLNRR